MNNNNISVERCIREGPEWLDKLLICNYFSPCLFHKSARPERNHFCTECNEGPICSVGLASSHQGHQTLQIRKASHHDAIRVCDIQKVIDISGIQCYSINGAKIVFLLRPKAKLHHGRSKKRCVNCKRGLNDAGMLMCSIKCKLSYVRESLGVANPNHNHNHNNSITLSLTRGQIISRPIKPIVIRGVISEQCNSASYNSKKRRIVKEGTNWLMQSMGEENIEGGDLIFSVALPVSPISVLHPTRSSTHSNTVNTNPGTDPHCSPYSHNGEIFHSRSVEEEINVLDVQGSSFRISLPLLEDGELTSSPGDRDHRRVQASLRKNRRKETPHRAPLW